MEQPSALPAAAETFQFCKGTVEWQACLQRSRALRRHSARKSYGCSLTVTWLDSRRPGPPWQAQTACRSMPWGRLWRQWALLNLLSMKPGCHGASLFFKNSSRRPSLRARLVRLAWALCSHTKPCLHLYGQLPKAVKDFARLSMLPHESYGQLGPISASSITALRAPLRRMGQQCVVLAALQQSAALLQLKGMTPTQQKRAV